MINTRVNELLKFLAVSIPSELDIRLILQFASLIDDADEAVVLTKLRKLHKYKDDDSFIFPIQTQIAIELAIVELETSHNQLDINATD